MLENQSGAFKNLIQQRQRSNWSGCLCVYSPDLHMLLSLLTEKPPHEKKKDLPWQLGASQLLVGDFWPHWLLMVDLCHVWKKMAFSESTLTSYFFQLVF